MHFIVSFLILFPMIMFIPFAILRCLLERAYSSTGLMTECFGERRGTRSGADRKRPKEKFEDTIKYTHTWWWVDFY